MIYLYMYLDRIVFILELKYNLSTPLLLKRYINIYTNLISRGDRAALKADENEQE